MNLTKNSRFKFVRQKKEEKVEQSEENICQRRRQKQNKTKKHTRK